MNKVLHVITTIERGGAENQLLTLVRHQINLGDDVEIAYLKNRPELQEEFLRAGAKVHRLRGSIVNQILTLKKLLLEGFDIAHAHLPRAEILLALANALNCFSSILVASRHNAESFFPTAPHWLSRHLSKCILRSYSSVIFISKAVRDFLLDAGEIPKRIGSYVVLYGFDDSYNFEHSYPPNPNSHIVNYLFVGRLSRQKNLPVLLKAFRELLKIYPECKLHIYGEGNLENELRSSVSDLSSNIIWQGKSSNIVKVMRSSDCLVLPSKYEGFGLVLLEAMQSNLPILAANNSAIPEVLGENHPGLFETEDSHKLLQKLVQIQDSIFREEILKYQISRLKNFEPHRMCSRVGEIYELSKKF